MHNPKSLVFTETRSFAGEFDLTATFTADPDFNFDPEPASDDSLFELFIAVAKSAGRRDFADEFRRRALEAKVLASADEPDPTPVIREIRP